MTSYYHIGPDVYKIVGSTLTVLDGGREIDLSPFDTVSTDGYDLILTGPHGQWELLPLPDVSSAELQVGTAVLTGGVRAAMTG